MQHLLDGHGGTWPEVRIVELLNAHAFLNRVLIE